MIIALMLLSCVASVVVWSCLVVSGRQPPHPPMGGAALLILGLLLAGCATTGNNSTSYPAALQAQCEQAYGQGRAQYVERFGEPFKPLYWQVTAIPGQRWGNQWAIHPTGVMVGGETVGNRTKIGVGPNMEVNQGDLAHEAFEAWCQVNGRKAH